MKALARLLEHEVMGEKARFMRYTAQCLWIMAIGKQADQTLFRPYSETVFDDVYRNPFMKKSEETGQEIIDKLLKGGVD